MGRREFASLADPVLAARLEEHRRDEARTIGALLISLVTVGLLILAVR